jgi:hypothetical protein
MTLFRFLLAGLLGATIIGGFGSARAKQGDVIEIIVFEDGSAEISCTACIAVCVDVEGQHILDAEFNKIGGGCRITVSDGLALQLAIEQLIEIIEIAALEGGETPAAAALVEDEGFLFLETIEGTEADAAQNTEQTADDTPQSPTSQ